MATETKPAATLQSVAGSDLVCPMCGSRRELALQNRGSVPVTCDECGGEFEVVLRPVLVET
ncbi:MAG: hypothetical protein MAG715_00138 [Methanonatronarchaeales archaeon]|nr:hypothetical protein [Methanonatronarchaeales archaeon]